MITFRYAVLVIVFLALIGLGIWMAYSHRREKDWWFYGSIVGSALLLFLLVVFMREWNRQIEQQQMWSQQLCSKLQEAQSQYATSGDVNQWSSTLAQWKQSRAENMADGQVDVDSLERCFINVMAHVQSPLITSHALSPTA